MLKLSFGLTFPDLYERSGLARLDAAFLGFLETADAAIAEKLRNARLQPDALVGKDESELILLIAPHLERFLSQLFGIADSVLTLKARHEELDALHRVKRQFVQRRAAGKIKPPEARQLDGDALSLRLDALLGNGWKEVDFANSVETWLADEANHAAEIELCTQYAAWALHTDEGREKHSGGVLFKQPRKLDPENLLLHAEKFDSDGVTGYRISPPHLRRRNGFQLTDPGTDLAGALDQANYCIWCHNQGKDSCSHGLKEKPTPGAAQPIVFKKSPFGVTLAGCPLEEKISEFHLAKSQGMALAALAIITIDNPLAAATGHRICNDCMKSCIYQKQEPVNIPEAETRTLKDVLELPWGFEIYSLLTRWNPLNLRRPLPKERSGYRVLVAGMGPAGFSLAHHLMNDGHVVVGIDGLKIEPLPDAISGVRTDGQRVPFDPIKDVSSLSESLDQRVMAGFGGVAEYGITVRWNKNFLKVIRLLLERRQEFSLFGGVRFGGTITLDDAWQLGFDHVALAMGAGKPTVLDIPNGLARGVRTASDFLMALQLTGAARSESIANMQVRLPVVVVGGGLTAIDTATESLAYYVVQVEKFLARYEALSAATSEQAVRNRWSLEEIEVAEEFLSHARAIRAERNRADSESRAPRIVELIQSWGGVSIAYRRRMIDSPAYTLNHEEVEKALEEGITFLEGLSPLSIDIDDRGAVCAINFKTPNQTSGETTVGAPVKRVARTIFVAAGTQPNTVLAREDAGHFRLDGKYFQACDEYGVPIKPQYSISKPDEPRVLLSRAEDGRFISFFGDLHPSYFGNVVKALGSTKQGHPVITKVLSRNNPASRLGDVEFRTTLNSLLRPKVHEVRRLTPTIVEVVLEAPQAARNFQPGQFYRLQNFETLSPMALGTRIQMEGLALTGAWVDKTRGLLSTIVLEMGGASDLCAMLQPGEPVVLMGPTGEPTHIEHQETVILVGGGLGNAVLFSIGQACRTSGSKVLYFAGYKRAEDRYKVSEIEAAADVIVWCCDEAPGFSPTRPQDKTFVGNIVQAMVAYGSGQMGSQSIQMQEARRLIAIGSDRMMAAVAKARHDILAPYLSKSHIGIGSINSPMQCMMKEICAQCLQTHRDPETGKITQVFSCFNQDQLLDWVDFQSLSERLKQNSLLEKLTAQWLRHCIPEVKKERSFV